MALGRAEQARSHSPTTENNLAYAPNSVPTARASSPPSKPEVGQVLAQGQTVVHVTRTDELEILVGVPRHRLKAVREAADASYEL